tara:strand:+ start:213 stop:962 length:750 start_codon:yes stop_codon:yes gene_type:complete
MSYFTFKEGLTSFIDTGDNMHPALDEVNKDTDKVINLKQGLIETVLIPARAVMTEYVKARQQYLNDNEPVLPSVSDTEFEWRSPLTHTYGWGSLSTQNAYGNYGAHNGLLTDWAIEHWTQYIYRSTLYWVACAAYEGKEQFSDIDSNKLAPLGSAPYSLDIAGRHSVANLTLQATNWVTGMKWIFATNRQYLEYTSGSPSDNLNPNTTYLNTYHTWGLNDKLDHNQTAVNALCARLLFKNDLKSLDSQF